jgi:dynein heavy chain, axonemal
MRALKAILTACGNLRRKISDWNEDFLCLRALNDVNKPKFTTNDVELYKGITSDLFPGVVLPVTDYSVLNNAMNEQCAKTNLMPKPIFLQKCIELYETICVRHGLMVVGAAFSGKSKVINILKRAWESIENDPNFAHGVENYFINPKSILQEQLYGRFDADTGEWSDGVLAITIRDCAESTTPDRKWIIFDGPVDAVWIENMNTVLDDNKKLCLSSG